MRRRLAYLASLPLLLAPALAFAAEDIGTINLKLQVLDGDNNFVDISDTQRIAFFNAANCNCHTPIAVEVSLTNAPTVLPDDTIQIWVGTNCADTTNLSDRNVRCEHIGTDIDVQAVRRAPVRRVIDVAHLISPNLRQGAACPEVDVTRTVWALVDENQDDSIEHQAQLAAGLVIDTEPPPVVTDLSLSGGEDAVVVDWTLPDTSGDIAHFQIVCASSKTGLPIFPSPTNDPGYERTEEVCGIAMPTPSNQPDAGVADAGTRFDAGPVADAAPAADAAPVADAGPTIDAGPGSDGGTPLGPAAFDALDPNYVCTNVISGASTEARIDLSGVVLADDEEVVVKVVSIDAAHNYSSVDAPGSATPQPVADFWEVYEGDGGQADGGFCFVATAAYGDYDHPYVKVLRLFRDHTLAKFGAGRAFIAWYYEHSPALADWLRAHPTARAGAAVLLFPVVIIAAGWEFSGPVEKVLALAGILSFFFLRRRRRLHAARAAAAAALLVGLLVARGASAQTFFDDDDEPVATRAPFSSWGFEIKAGPYFPDIDGESGLTGTPYETMFSDDWSLMGQIELDWYPFHFFGELGLGAMVGWMGQSAKAFVADPVTGEPTSERSEADGTSFHLIPTSLLAVYRFTELADQTVIPIVPYAKLGLSYYIWWSTKGGGEFAQTANGDDAVGGTLGWQGTLGVSVRAEKIDPDSAHDLQSEMGIEHVGFFFEMTYANVSGLGASDRLHVGDTTWFAGVNFEF